MDNDLHAATRWRQGDNVHDKRVETRIRGFNSGRRAGQWAGKRMAGMMVIFSLFSLFSL